MGPILTPPENPIREATRHGLCAWRSVVIPSTSYEPRQPAAGVLHQVVRDHFETLRAQATDLRDGEGLPGFVEQEFREFLQCGALAAGFARFRCADSSCDVRGQMGPRIFCSIPWNC